MASVNQICETLIRSVTNSDLDYKMHQTPFSLFFSIRKKFNKHSTNAAIFPDNPVQNQDLLEKFRGELFNVRNEYANLYGFYQTEIEAKKVIEHEMESIKEERVEKDSLINDLETEIKKLKLEKKSMREKFDEKCVETKKLKVDISDLNKDKNALRVAMKSVKKEAKEQSKILEKKLETNEKKILELEDFRAKRLNKEREERIKRKKELKKEAKKSRNNNESEKPETPVEKEVDEEAFIEAKEMFVDQNLNFMKSEAASIGDIERVHHEEVEEEISVETDEANETVIKEDVENEDEGSGGEHLFSKEDFLELFAKHREESKADRTKFFQDLRKDLWTDR